MPTDISTAVTAGMKRICSDFHTQIKPRGFHKGGSRWWVRDGNGFRETIDLHRNGSTYGTPISASVSIRVILGVTKLDGSKLDGDYVLYSDNIRRSTGYAYHHRFNAQTWSTYDRCRDELALFVSEFAEQWFAQKLRDAKV